MVGCDYLGASASLSAGFSKTCQAHNLADFQAQLFFDWGHSAMICALNERLDGSLMKRIPVKCHLTSKFSSAAPVTIHFAGSRRRLELMGSLVTSRLPSLPRSTTSSTSNSRTHNATLGQTSFTQDVQTKSICWTFRPRAEQTRPAHVSRQCVGQGSLETLGPTDLIALVPAENNGTMFGPGLAPLLSFNLYTRLDRHLIRLISLI